MKFEMVEIGMFRLPGLMVVDDDENPVREEDIVAMREWAAEDPKKHGKEVIQEKRVWAFKNEKQRNYFIMRWG